MPHRGKIQAGINDRECRLIAKDYLQCRMDNNLMAKDEMKNLGLDFTAQISVEADQGTTKPQSTGTPKANE
jgi:cytochrome c oxidase assembly protein subunit 19